MGALDYDLGNVPVTIGADWNAGQPGDMFHGLIDEVSIYDRALSGEEILAIFNADVAGKNTAMPYFYTDSPLPTAALGKPYSQQLSVALGRVYQPFTGNAGTGRPAPQTVRMLEPELTVSAGALPPGIILSPAGALSGQPSQPGLWDFTVRATVANTVTPTNPLGNGTERLYVLPVGPPAVPPPAGPEITTGPVLPAATTGQPYFTAMTSTGGDPPVAYTTISGVIPPGLTLNSAGVLAGTPSVPGGYAFTILATDAKGLFAEQPFTVNVQ